VFLLQAEYAQRAIQHAIGDASTHHSEPTDIRGSAAQRPDFALDGRLAGVCVALVLLSTTLSSILLAERGKDGRGAITGPAEVVTLTRLCHDTISASRSPTGSGFIEELLGMMVPWYMLLPPLSNTIALLFCSLETLRLLDRFLPRINVGKIKPSSPNGKDGVPGGGGRSPSADAAGFPYLKRDLVRLLGILCHNCKAMQDRIRSCGGIPVVLNLCHIDDRNPCEFYFRPRGFACCTPAQRHATLIPPVSRLGGPDDDDPNFNCGPRLARTRLVHAAQFTS